MNAVDIIIIIIIAALLSGAVLSVVRRRKRGCSCGCEGCTMKNKCGSSRSADPRSK